MSNYNRTLWGMLVTLFGRTEQIPLPPSQPIEKEDLKPDSEQNLGQNLSGDWEWMLSTAEELTLHQEQERVKEIRNELSRIAQASNSIQIRPRIGSLLREQWKTLSAEDLDLLSDSRLDASKRDRILKDLIRKETTSWRDQFATLLPVEERENLISRWEEQKYKKNISGEMAVMAFRASHPAQEKGLTAKICGDILWSISVCLSKEILSPNFDQNLRISFDDLLLEKIVSLISPLLSLWKQTAASVRDIANREGRLPSIWAEEQKKEEERLAQIKITGASARYNDRPDPLKKDSSSSDPLLSASTFASRRALIAANLPFGIPAKRV